MSIVGFIVVAAVLTLLCLIAVPVIMAGALIGLLLYLVLQLFLLPFRLLGLTFVAGAGLLILTVKLFLLFVLGLVGMALLLAFSLPLLPLLLLGLGLWLLIRSRRPARSAVV